MTQKTRTGRPTHRRDDMHHYRFERTPEETRSAIASELRAYRRYVRNASRIDPSVGFWNWGHILGMAYPLGEVVFGRVRHMLAQIGGGLG